MATSVVRFTLPGQPEQAHWGVLFARRIAPLAGTYATTADFVRRGQAEARAMTAANATISFDEVKILSPVTTNQQFLCQGANYGSHVRESGKDPSDMPFNTFFTKASSSLTGPYDDVVRPAHVKLLDYEIELGLVVGRDLTSAVQVKPDRLHEVLAGITIVNDVSARDVQLPQGQFYKGKSYRTFGPAGPVLLLLEQAEWLRWPDLHMQLSVNGQVRQEDYCRDMLYKPHQTVSEFSALQDLQAGDLIATGTPAGCAAKAPGKLSMFVGNRILSEPTKWKMFVKGGLRNQLYLQPNDVMNLSIRTDDGALDLGQQRNVVVSA
ncbi:MAG: fumarylacetoacetate hydrolase [Leptothrix sp. (in: Bacteria)]|nr:fumarylacetoacetate hydrolase [Leptothrix sp. (in: b-proteobacteria)]